MKVTLTRGTIYSDLTRRKSPYYKGLAGDGTRFDNTCLTTLRSVLRRKYGKDVEIVETWKSGQS
jgi:hypothetical protein